MNGEGNDHAPLEPHPLNKCCQQHGTHTCCIPRLCAIWTPHTRHGGRGWYPKSPSGRAQGKRVVAECKFDDATPPARLVPLPQCLVTWGAIGSRPRLSYSYLLVHTHLGAHRHALRAVPFCAALGHACAVKGDWLGKAIVVGCGCHACGPTVHRLAITTQALPPHGHCLATTCHDNPHPYPIPLQSSEVHTRAGLHNSDSSTGCCTVTRSKLLAPISTPPSTSGSRPPRLP